MSNTAPERSEQELEDAARMFKALSNPHRLRIFKTLSTCWAGQIVTGPVENFSNCQREFAERLGLAPSTVSHHFKELRQAGLIHMKRDGKDMLFWVDDNAVKALRALLDG
ncbi:ArsR/SmtB family transcription factor [Solidesulfovibrio magneticus]|uniref:ArsR family transcriptional regulator n=1 Tax=Solidesulfovibrio magneticus (strain ATCC 700980 / DSM 13731 / RS-1) TaxID=573370 RepID=C4XND6_SOLM1|nr:metalloregulator ArsR/SmtB family transcription factor [Solidesulfovibrio magneticus]BAH77439.1 ArsR family transcriptional regulator [Solidesulfovibrio magneticus RS-1]